MSSTGKKKHPNKTKTELQFFVGKYEDFKVAISA